jgi:tRNA modification GTPase
MTLLYRFDDDIAALATPPGEGGIAIIRISGKNAVNIASKVFSGPVNNYASHTVHLGSLQHDGKTIDKGLLLLMLAPRSYTGENVVELHCHGGMVVSNRVLEAVLRSGARLAYPGEFTYRAFMNGKMDLAQAEAVQMLIGAKNKYALDYSEKVLSGALSNKILAMQQQLLHVAAILEAWVDFPEEGLEFASLEEILADMQAIISQLEALIASYEDGKKVFHGISLAIIGEPNAGKSSLLNALLDEERAIVTPIAGTTRDLLHEDLTLGGVTFRLTDTAGIRDTEDTIEKEGIRRSLLAIEKADWILAVLDLTKPLPDFISSLPSQKTLFVLNKADLTNGDFELSVNYKIKISAKNKLGIDELRRMLISKVWEGSSPDQEGLLIHSKRHYEALIAAKAGVEATAQGIRMQMSPEWLTADLRGALVSLGEILGQDVTEEVLGKIFSTFCVGK